MGEKGSGSKKNDGEHLVKDLSSASPRFDPAFRVAAKGQLDPAHREGCFFGTRAEIRAVVVSGSRV